MKEQAILFNSTYCTGCNTCTYKCVQEFGDQSIAAQGLFRTLVLIKDDGILKKQCMQCKDPQCVEASQGAFTKTAYGAVLMEGEKLKDGKTVAGACPFHAIQQDGASGKVIDCNLCAHRLTEGRKPACVEVCLSGALESGDYEVMVAKAKDLASSKKLHIYGLKENGGTRLLILTKADPVSLGYPNVGRKRLRAGLIEDLGATPLLAGAVYVGLKKYSDRRAAVAATQVDGESGSK
jgi:formate dehydrogenase iron-sulfur subunit